VVITDFELLFDCFDGRHSWDAWKASGSYRSSVRYFQKWWPGTAIPDIVPRASFANWPCNVKTGRIFGDLSAERPMPRRFGLYIQMTDRFAIELFNELIPIDAETIHCGGPGKTHLIPVPGRVLARGPACQCAIP
jgi:hypothetical protein